MGLRNQTAEDSSPLIQWHPREAWSNGNTLDNQLSVYSQGSFMLTTTFGANASFAFTGTGVWIYGGKRGNHGPYQCALDGATSPQQSGFSSTQEIPAQLCGFSNVPMGYHVMTITNQPADLVNAPYLDVDFIVWETQLSDEATVPTTIVDDTDPSITYSQTWTTNQCNNVGNYYSTTCHLTGTPNASVSFNFSGDAIAVYGGVGPTYGPYSVAVDNNTEGEYTANAVNSHAQELLYFTSGLGLGNHTVTLTNQPAQNGDVLDVDYFQVIAGFHNSEDHSSSGGVSIAAIVGPIAGALALVALCLLGFFFWKKHLRRPHGLDLTGEDDTSDNTTSNMAMVRTPYHVAGGHPIRQGSGGESSRGGANEPGPPVGVVPNSSISNWMGAMQYTPLSTAAPNEESDGTRWLSSPSNGQQQSSTGGFRKGNAQNHDGLTVRNENADHPPAYR